MISLFMGLIQKQIHTIVKTFSLIVSNPLLASIFLLTGLTFEEIFYGFRIIKYVGLI